MINVVVVDDQALVRMGLRTLLDPWFFAGVGKRFLGLAALVGIGGAVYFAVAWMIGGIDREAIMALRRKRGATQ